MEWERLYREGTIFIVKDNLVPFDSLKGLKVCSLVDSRIMVSGFFTYVTRTSRGWNSPDYYLEIAKERVEIDGGISALVFIDLAYKTVKQIRH